MSLLGSADGCLVRVDDIACTTPRMVDKGHQQHVRNGNRLYDTTLWWTMDTNVLIVIMPNCKTEPNLIHQPS